MCSALTSFLVNLNEMLAIFRVCQGGLPTVESGRQQYKR